MDTKETIQRYLRREFCADYSKYHITDNHQHCDYVTLEMRLELSPGTVNKFLRGESIDSKDLKALKEWASVAPNPDQPHTSS